MPKLPDQDPKPADEAQAAPAPTRILVCDDDAHMRDSIVDNLEVEGYEVVPAATGREAVEFARKDFYDVILMDYKLTDSTGIEVIKQIRTRNSESQILMLTAHASLDVAVKSIQEAVYDFILKPVDFSYLKRAIAKSVEKLRLRQENKRLIEDLKKVNAQLSSLNQMKSKFLSMSSHDLSNALMTLQVSFEMLSGSMAPTDEQKKRMGYISSGISQIKRLVEDLVDWASIEQGRFRLEKDWFSPGALVEEIVIGPQGRATARGLELSTKVEGNLPMVWADRRRISQVLNNLLENAMRHTTKGGSVVLSVGAKGEDVVFAVHDTGEGISPNELGKIFQSFYQVSGQKEQGRLGLGLSISREIAESHGGRISVDSPGQGKGATFSFSLPVKAP